MKTIQHLLVKDEISALDVCVNVHIQSKFKLSKYIERNIMSVSIIEYLCFLFKNIFTKYIL